MPGDHVLGRRGDIKVVAGLSPRDIAYLLDRGVVVYLFYPVAEAVRLFEIPRDGALYRILRPRSRPLPTRF